MYGSFTGQVPSHSQLLANLLSQQPPTNNPNPNLQNFGLNVKSITAGVNNDGSAKSSIPETAQMPANNRNDPSSTSVPLPNPPRGSSMQAEQPLGDNKANLKVDTSNDAGDIVANAVAAYNARPQDWTLEQLGEFSCLPDIFLRCMYIYILRSQYMSLL